MQNRISAIRRLDAAVLPPAEALSLDGWGYIGGTEIVAPLQVRRSAARAMVSQYVLSQYIASPYTFSSHMIRPDMVRPQTVGP